MCCNYDVCEIILRGKPQLAVPDNQLSANMTSLEFGVTEGVEVHKVKIPFIFGDGSVHYSIRQATVDCVLRSSPHVVQAYDFYIFPDLITSVILGRKFLHDARISRYPKRLPDRLHPDDDDLDARSVWTTRSLSGIEYSRWQIRVVIQHGTMSEDIGIVCDKGSDINAMSFAYAQSIGIDIERSQEHHILLADGTTTETSGLVYASLRFHGRASRLGQIQLEFVLIDRLPFHAAVGSPFIEQYKLIDDMHDFDWTFIDDEEALLCMMRSHKGKSL